MYSALVIASKFIDLGIEKGYPVTPMKLQKMVYFAHGLNLLNYNKKLINDNIQAWDYGPVIPTIYHTLKEFGNTEIVENPIRVGITFKSGFIRQDILDDDSESTINLVFELTKNMSAVQLSNWSHAEGSPWQQVYYSNNKSKNIDDETIKNYFLRVTKDGE